jgi:hypothetical protein
VTARSGPLRLLVVAIARRVLARDQPVTATRSPEHPAPVLLGGRGVLPGVLLRDLMTCRHRQPLTHPPSPLQRPKLDPGFASTPPVGRAPPREHLT